jgi:RNA polymerase sigma factor (TIGR02999 family)
MSHRSDGEPSTSLSDLLSEVRFGSATGDALVEQLYPELHRLAMRCMARERRNHTLQPTALVNEAYARLINQPKIAWQSKAHFLEIAARLMRQILVDHARTRLTQRKPPDHPDSVYSRQRLFVD